MNALPTLSRVGLWALSWFRYAFPLMDHHPVKAPKQQQGKRPQGYQRPKPKAKSENRGEKS